MNDAERYNRQFELIMQEIQADASLKENADRDAIWRKIERSFNGFADSVYPPWSPQKLETVKNDLLDQAVKNLR
jgi:hypothetical protein